MEPQTTRNEHTRKIIHDIRSHLSVILAVGETAIYDEKTITREEAISALKKSIGEVDEIMKLLAEI
ncbi:MAG: hypothetical protein WCT49_02215 [Candidatus Paceibacterota bacterium]|jgi:hypothetical protein|nr:hypothetical protein [Candidatus Paceibacterota bacterium]